MAFFYVLHIKDRRLSDCVEAIRFLSDPQEKHRAHITVRGPYEKRIDISNLNRLIAGDVVAIDRVGNFFDAGQNTVYFACSSKELGRVWKKKDYPFNPHITLYDSGSSEFARRLYEVLSKYKYNVSFRVDQLEPIEWKKGQKSFSLGWAFNSGLVSRVAKQRVQLNCVRRLTEERRLEIIDRLCRYLSTFSRQQPLFS